VLGIHREGAGGGGGGSGVYVMSGRGLRAHIRAFASLVLGGIAVAAGCTAAAADTLEWALVQAYQNNPSLNAQRAALRVTDENVPQALSGYRPKLSITSTDGFAYSSTLSQSVNQQVFPNTVSYSNIGKDMGQRNIGATATETLFNGFQTANKTRQAESQVMGARETLRVTEQQVLLDAATSYMNLLRDQAILDLNRSNVEVLTEQLKQTRDRFNVGEVTRTDVAQAESRLAAGRSALLGAQSNYVTSQANYRRVIGVDPGRLNPGTPVDRLSPQTLAGAITEGQTQSPSVLAAMYGVDIAELGVKISEGALYPNLSLTASAAKSYQPAYNVIKQTSASVLGTLTIPIYQGGAEYSAIRQSKETVGQQRLNLDVNRDQARATVVASWGQLDASKAQIEATTAQVNAAEIALNGVREEARVGQRTTLDVLNAQQELVNARVALVTAQHDRVVASYTLLAAVGGLSMQHLGLNVLIYDPQVHYQQVRDAWIGVRTPDGK
jgi:outer membrane protein